MVSGRFLFVSWSGGGNTAPTYPLVHQLVARGHQVTILGQSVQSETARALGARFAPLGVPDWTPGKSLEEEPDVFFELLFGPTVGAVVLERITQDRPDVVVVDCMLASGLAAAERSGIPSAAVVHVLYNQFVHGTMGALWSAMMPKINATRTGLGLPLVDSPGALLDPMSVVLVACPREFDLATQAVPPNIRYVGAILDDPPRSGMKSPWRSAGREPRVLVAFGTTCQHQEELLLRVAAALAGLPIQAVITTGPSVDPAAVDAPPNVALHRYIPHRALLPDCALVVTHAGLGAVMASLAHGVPLMCMPMGREQHDNAARVAACGAGTVLAADAAMSEIRDTIQAMLGAPEYRAAATRMAAVIAHQNGRETAVKELERLVRAT
jgi:MGT family glycosyltransferase